MEFCAECGTRNDDSAMLCTNCGINLQEMRPAKSQPASSIVEEKIKPVDSSKLICTSCGFENDDGVKFCGKCGQPMNLVASSNTSQPVYAKFCSQCGEKSDGKTKFCGSCGNSLIKETINADNLIPENKSVSFQDSRYQPPAHARNANYQQAVPVQNTRFQARSENYMANNLPNNFSHPKKKNSALALILAFIIPGFGYLYVSKYGEFAVYFFGMIFLAFIPLVNIIFYVYQIYKSKQIVDTYNLNLYKQQGNIRY